MITACRQAGLLPCRQILPSLCRCICLRKSFRAVYHLASERTIESTGRNESEQCSVIRQSTFVCRKLSKPFSYCPGRSYSALHSAGTKAAASLKSPEMTSEPSDERKIMNGEDASMTEIAIDIDRSTYVKKVLVQALRVPKGECHQLVKKLAKFKAEYPKIRNVVVEDGRPDTRLILLSQAVSGPELAELPEGLAAELTGNSDIEVTQHEIVLDYDCYTADQVLREVLPPGAEVPSSFETIGHVAHVNLRDELLPYKKVIGEVLLEKNFPRIRTILNKVGTIENEFRVPTFEVLAGDPSTVTEVKQHSARFQLDYAQVYWNSRLEFEHTRLVEQFKRDDVICDMFAGIGPFAIPAALKGCAVYANDLNPQSTHYLAINCKLNKVSHRVRVSTLDAREFVRVLVRPSDGASSEPPAPQETAALASGDQLEPRLERPVNTEPAFGVSSDRASQEMQSKERAPEGEVHSLNGSKDAQECVGSGQVDGSSNGAIDQRHTDKQGGSSSGQRDIPNQNGSQGEVKDQSNIPEGLKSGLSNGEGQQKSAKVPSGKPGMLAKGGKPPPLRPPKEPVPETPQRIDHVVMNLPASGIEFLDVFNGLFDPLCWKAPLPRIHCYCFARAFETDADVIRRAEEALGGAIPEPVVWNVRDVAPNKTMLCVTFTLPAAVAFRTNSTRADSASQTPRLNGGNSSVPSPTEPLTASKKSRVY